jgi:hypothetical protein
MMHTTGPWVCREHTDEDDCGDIATVAVVSSWVVGVQYPDRYQCSYEDHGGDEADARLISAAPDLLDVARKAIAAWTGDGSANVMKLLDELRAAIAKAEGK